jgi:two-component system, LytTR family, response regulator
MSANALHTSPLHSEGRRVPQPSTGDRASSPIDGVTELLKPGQPKKLALRTKGRIVFIDPVEALAIEAQGNAALMRTLSGAYLLRQSISDVAEKLGQYGFIRIHRSTVVNGAFVEEVRVLNSGEMLLRLKGADKEYSISRTYRSALKAVAACWL